MWYYVYAGLAIIIITKLYLRFNEVPIDTTPKDLKDPQDPKEFKIFTQSELLKYTKNPILIAIKSKVYDVSKGESFYGPDGPYSGLAGKDATLALAQMKTDPSECDVKVLTTDEEKILQDWIARFDSKYPVVGSLAK